MTRSTSLLTLSLTLYCLILPLMSLLVPRGVAPLLVAAALLAALLAWHAGLRLSLPDRNLVVAFGVLLGWCAISLIWGLVFQHAAILIGRIVVLLASGGLLFAVAGALEDEVRARLCRWLAIGTALSLAVMAVEIAFDFPLVQILQPKRTSPEEIRVGLSRGATALAILVWPVAGYLWTAGSRRAALALPIAIGLMLPFLSSLSAVFGLGAGAAMTAISGAHEKAGRVFLILATLAAFVGSPVAGKLMYAEEWQSAQWMPWTAQHRIEIWNFTTDLIEEKPILGWGFDSSRAISKDAPDEAESGRPTMSLHPHNGPLQILLEIGLVGGMIALTLTLMLTARLEALPRPTRSFARGMYLSILVVAAVAYGLWQNQWLALMISAAVLLRLTVPGRLQGHCAAGETELSADARA